MVKIYLYEIRTERKMSIRKLADLSGVSRTHINNIENGGTSPTIDCLCQLAIALHVDIHELIQCKEDDAK